MRLTLSERFWSKVSKTDGCWNWTATRSKSGTGYGQISVNDRLTAAHRVSWELHFGPVPDGLFVLHRCDNKACVNPAHLFLGNNSDNLIDAARKSSLGRNQRLSPASVEQIRRLRREGMTSREIASMFGITEGHARKVAVGSTAWAHVEGGVRKNYPRAALEGK